MNWDAISAVGTLIGGVAVIISLIYLGVQTQQNTKAMRSASFHQVRVSFSDISLTLAQDPNLVSIIARVHSEPSTLSSEEVMRYEMVLLTIIRRAESAYFQSIEGTLAKESWHGIAETCKTALADKIAQRWWARTEHRFEASFSKSINELIERENSEQPRA